MCNGDRSNRLDNWEYLFMSFSIGPQSPAARMKETQRRFLTAEIERDRMMAFAGAFAASRPPEPPRARPSAASASSIPLPKTPPQPRPPPPAASTSSVPSFTTSQRYARRPVTPPHRPAGIARRREARYEDPFYLINLELFTRLRDHPKVIQSISTFGLVEPGEIIGFGQFTEWTYGELLADLGRRSYLAWILRQFISGDEPRAEGYWGASDLHGNAVVRRRAPPNGLRYPTRGR